MNSSDSSRPNWQGRACPMSFAGRQAPQASMVIAGTMEAGGSPGEREVMSCLGPSCMFYIPLQERDETTGEIAPSIHGSCAPVLQVAATNQQTQVYSQLISRMMDEYQLRRKNS